MDECTHGADKLASFASCASSPGAGAGAGAGGESWTPMPPLLLAPRFIMHRGSSETC